MVQGRLVPGRLILSLALAISVLPSLVSIPAAAGATPDAAGALTFSVFGYREGLVGGTTANGHVIQPNDHFVALPCACALSSKGGNEFQVQIEYNGKTVTAPVWDVGPWNTHDNYWDPSSERTYSDLPQGVPEAQAAYEDGYNNGRDGSGRKVGSPGGIDIGDGTFADLGMTDSDWVKVTFLWTKGAPQKAAFRPAIETLPALPSGYEDMPTVYSGDRPPLDAVDAKDPSLYHYFALTGHNVPNVLMDYWNTHGSWRNVGLPISEIFRQVNDDGSTRLTQFFERQVLEWNAGDDEKPIVTSNLIGYTASAPDSARAKIDAFESNDHAVYFPQTGHQLANGFLHYWQDNGGLATFGYPITEEFSGETPDGRKYVAQVFERARFEWWPDKAGQPGDITQGLLGVELLQKEGWLER
jgi:hypothetical protein